MRLSSQVVVVVVIAAKYQVHVSFRESTKESANMRSDRKAGISGLAATEHARNRILLDLPSV